MINRCGIETGGHNPIGVDHAMEPFPRVARCAQPWAIRRNPVGVLKGRTIAPHHDARPTWWVMSTTYPGPAGATANHKTWIG